MIRETKKVSLKNQEFTDRRVMVNGKKKAGQGVFPFVTLRVSKKMTIKLMSLIYMQMKLIFIIKYWSLKGWCS